MDIEVERRGQAAVIWLNRPEDGNRASSAMMQQGMEALRSLQQEPLKFIAVAGRGQDFCTGRWPGEPGGPALRGIAAFSQALADSPVPTVALVRGKALAAGAGMALHCDLLLVEPDAQIGYPEMTHGIVPGLVLVYLDRLLPRPLASRLIYTGQPLSGSEIAGLGLGQETSDPLSAFDALVDRFEEVPTVHFSWLKRFRQRVPSLSSEAVLDEGIRLIELCVKKDAEGIERLLEG